MKKKHDILIDQIRDWLKESPTDTPSEQEIRQTEDALLAFAKAHEETPPAELRSRILEKLHKLNHQKNHRQALDLNNLPLLEASSNWLDWQQAVACIEPPEDFEGIHLHTIESNEQRELFVVWVKDYVEEEVHYDLLESFLILEGTCECHITNEAGQSRTVRLGQGDFISIELGEKHDIRITSLEPTKAILQWKKLAS